MGDDDDADDVDGVEGSHGVDYDADQEEPGDSVAWGLRCWQRWC